MNERKGGELAVRLQERRQCSVVTVCHNTNRGNEKTPQQMACVSLTDPLLTSEHRNLSSLQICGFIIIWHTNDYMCADCCPATLRWIFGYWDVRLFFPSPLFSSSKNFVNFVSLQKKISDCKSPLNPQQRRGSPRFSCSWLLTPIISQISAVKRKTYCQT